MQADMTEVERWEAYQQTPGYIARQCDYSAFPIRKCSDFNANQQQP